MEMFLLIFVAFGYLPQSMEYQDVALRDIIIDKDVTGILGEEVHLRCVYSGKHDITDSCWKHQVSDVKVKAVAGYRNGMPFAKDNFSMPISHTNLTVKVTIKSLKVEGNYACVFSTDDYDFMEKMFLKVIARPRVNTHTEEDFLNGTYYQNIMCSASYAKPSASLHWDIHGAPPREDIFSIHNTNSTVNGTVSIVSMLRFPIHRNNESSVACVIQHPALPEPNTTIIKLQTFVSPTVTVDVTLTEKEGKALFMVLCRAKGGRPHPSINWIQPESADTSCTAHFMDFESVSHSHCFPVEVYQGENITCAFSYPDISAIEKTITLPTYYLTSLQLTNISIKGNHSPTSDLLIFYEEDSDIRIGMEVLGHVPRYEINCTKDGKSLSEDVNVVVNDLIIKGPVGKNHSGQYLCEASYYNHSASLQFKIEVKPRLKVSALIHMTLLSNVTWDNGTEYTEVKCMAENVSPDVNITWHTADCRSGIDASEPGTVVPGSQQDHSVIWKMARIPVHSYAGCKVICVVHHPALEKPMQKCIQIPSIEPVPHSPSCGNLSVGLQNNSTHWAAVCKCESDEAMINILWVITDTNKTALPSIKNTTTEGSRRIVTSIYKFDRYKHEGKFLTCVIQSELGEVGRRAIQVPRFFMSSIAVLNKTLPLHGSRGQHTGVLRVALKEHVSNQRIIFKVNGNTSECNFKCFRSNGLSAHTVGLALVFAQQVSESDAGLYTCSASWYHHNATVTVLVDVISQEMHSMMLILTCFSSAVAITIIMVVTLCIFCKRSEETHSSTKDWKKRESLAALMQDPRSPELKKASGQDYAVLVPYAIVIDVKTTV